MSAFDAIDVIRTKRDGGQLSAGQIRWVVDAYTRGVVPDEQVSALLMAVFFRGMAPDDTELMLWALAHGWSVKVFSGHAHGSLWRDPARHRFLVYGDGPSPGRPAGKAYRRRR